MTGIGMTGIGMTGIGMTGIGMTGIGMTSGPGGGEARPCQPADPAPEVGAGLRRHKVSGAERQLQDGELRPGEEVGTPQRIPV